MSYLPHPSRDDTILAPAVPDPGIEVVCEPFLPGQLRARGGFPREGSGVDLVTVTLEPTCGAGPGDEVIEVWDDRLALRLGTLAPEDAAAVSAAVHRLGGVNRFVACLASISGASEGGAFRIQLHTTREGIVRTAEEWWML